MGNKHTESYEELIRAIKKVSKPVKLSFLRNNDDGIPVVSLVIEGIDNKYYQFNDKKYPAYWEIYLKSDGTWEIV